MRTISILFLVSLLISPFYLFAQRVQKDNTPVLELDKSELLKGQKIVAATEEKNTADYKIISSNSSYIEIEFYPKYNKPNVIDFQGQQYLTLDFDGAVGKTEKDAGQPDLRKRVFSVMFPSEVNNKVTVTDYQVNDAPNINLAPVPTVIPIKANPKNPEDYKFLYLRDSKTFSQNKFYPENIASLEAVGRLRDGTIGNLVIFPYQYNPVTRQMKQYTRIRVRITFGQSPVYLNKPRSKEEISLLKGVALNSDLAMNWVNPGTRNIKRVSPQVTNSPFATGDWYKIEIKDNSDGQSEGVYKMTKSFLESAGINLSGVDPRTIKMYGNGGGLLPEDMNVVRPSDIQPIPIFIYGEDDGHFDTQDFILFYASSVNKWNYDTATGIYSHVLDYYSSSNYYWICLNTPGPIDPEFRMISVPSENGNNQILQTTFKERIFLEQEQSNLISEGNLWLSERKNDGESFVWNTNMTGLAADSNILYIVKPASRVVNSNAPGPCPYNVVFKIKDDNTSVAELNYPMQCINPGFGAWITTSVTSFSVNASLKTPPNSEATSLRATFQCGTPDGEGYMDWMEIQYPRRLNSAANDLLRFDSPNINGVVEYNVSSFSGTDIRVFDVTNHNGVKMIQPISSSTSDVRFQKTQVRGSLSRFVVAGPNGYKTPTSISQRVANQNLHGISDGASFVIITHPDFMAAANRIKAKREAGGPGSANYLHTSIFTCDQIYNEFSGGVLDAVALRDFLKEAYENWQERPVYVLLLGSGSFDYKNIFAIADIKNWVPPYEVTDPQIDQVAGYVTDDFFANVVDDPAGRPDVGIGRIPAKNLNGVNDANNYLDKIDCYEDPVNNGYWKNRMVFVADDGYSGDLYDGTQFTDQSEDLSENHTPQVFDRVKLYLIAYPTVITAQGKRKPGVNADIIKSWNAGCLNIHYIGHGSPDVWAHEYVLEKDVVMSQIHNQCQYPFVSIASCDMSKFDDPNNVCAAAKFVITANKGAIGTLAASRPVYGTSNAILMQYFFDRLYGQRDTLLYPVRFGKAIFQTKQFSQSYSDNDKKFIFLGDPSLRMAIPRFQTRIDSISGLNADTMRALSKVKIYGSIINPDSSFWSGFNGNIYVKVYDVPRQIEIDEVYQGLVYAFRFKLAGGIIYSGYTNVTNGKWSTEYVVPKDLSYLNQNGKLVNYFYNNQADGASLYTNFIVGGINPDAPVDTTGPRINAYLNNRNFRSGDVVNENFKLIADMFDESGINTTGTIGHKIEATLDGNESNKYDLTTYYNSDTSYKSGSLSYDFTGIGDGNHTLNIRAWDTYNNSSQVTIKFEVVSSGVVQVVNVYNFPNPFRDGTAFTYQHNYPGLVSTKIKIYTVAGRLIKEIDQPATNDKFVYIPWNGKDADGQTLSNGIYIYKVVVTTDAGTAITNVGKLAVLK